MCGISGILSRDRTAAIDRPTLQVMADAVRHRGPDGEGFFVEGGIGLAHRRLAIIDPAAGQQPMTDPETGNVIVYNGEVYNYVELRAELAALGHRFRTDSDTEVILKAWLQWGPASLARLNGMWAFALWDRVAGRLFLARDRLGIKPLHYAWDGERLVFGSEMKSLFAAGVPRVPDTSFLDVYLSLGYIPAPHSFFKGIAKLAPGHCLSSDGGEPVVTRWWDLPAVEESRMTRDRDAVREEFAATLRNAVRISMRSDVPFGAFLSGGLDSASIVTLMAQQLALPVETFTIGFEDRGFDERELARMVAARAATNHHEEVVRPENLGAALDLVCRHYDEPFGDSSAIPTGHVARLAARHVKMVLTGDGGDEVLSGYPAYQVEKIAGAWARVPEPARRIAEAALGGVARVAGGRQKFAALRWQRLLATTARPFLARLLAKAAWLDGASRAEILAGHRTVPVEDVVADLMKPCPWADPFYRLMYWNLKVSLPDDMLTKVDRMTMSASLEARVPFLDYRLVELMAGVHKAVKLPGLTRKAVLRDTVGHQLPKPLLKGAKRGFVFPFEAWNRDVEQRALIAGLKRADWALPGPRVAEITSQHLAGERDHGNLIWMLLVLQKSLGASAAAG